MSVILEKFSQDFVHPTPFEIHYSPLHKERYLADGKYICGGFEDPDLAAHMTIIKHRGICLYGEEINSVFCEIPREAYIDSLIYDIQGAKDDIVKNPVYVCLNLCRVLYYLTESAICSKLEGGNWGIEVLSQIYRQLINDAINVYMDQLNRDGL